MCVLYSSFPYFYLFIYFSPYKNFPPVSRNFHLFSVLKLLINISPRSAKISPKPHLHVRTFSAPLLLFCYFRSEGEKKKHSSNLQIWVSLNSVQQKRINSECYLRLIQSLSLGQVGLIVFVFRTFSVSQMCHAYCNFLVFSCEMHFLLPRHVIWVKVSNGAEHPVKLA